MAIAYIESSVPSFYVARPSRQIAMLAKQQSTRDWWDGGCSGLEIVTSLETIDEIGRGEPVMARDRLTLVSELPILEVTDDVVVIADGTPQISDRAAKGGF